MSDRSFQLKSMTAFGGAVSDFSGGRFRVEIQSVNRRFLEVNVSLPRLLARFEMEVRKLVSARAGRGMVNVSVAWKAEHEQTVSVRANIPLAHALKGAWEKLAGELGLDKTLPLAVLTQEKDLWLHEEELGEEGIYLTALTEAVDKALTILQSMKELEGKALARDLDERLAILALEITQIEGQAWGATEKYRQKLTARLQEILGSASEIDEKIVREVAVYAEKVDITEEITRFKSHLEQFGQMLRCQSEQTGKGLDFLLQELLRESNTIGSKASDLAVIQRVVRIKSELEKMKEQVQNIE